MEEDVLIEEEVVEPVFEYGQIIEYADGTFDTIFNKARRWCMDNNATLDELVDERNEGVRYFKINEVVNIEIPHVFTLEELKQQKREEINNFRDSLEQGGFEYMGKVFDSDPISCQRISCAAQAMQLSALAEETASITWTCQDNTTIDLNPTELLGLVGALAAWSNSCHIKATKLKEQIEACQSAETLAQITWD